MNGQRTRARDITGFPRMDLAAPDEARNEVEKIMMVLVDENRSSLEEYHGTWFSSIQHAS